MSLMRKTGITSYGIFLCQYLLQLCGPQIMAKRLLYFYMSVVPKLKMAAKIFLV